MAWLIFLVLVFAAGLLACIWHRGDALRAANQARPMFPRQTPAGDGLRWLREEAREDGNERQARECSRRLADMGEE